MGSFTSFALGFTVAYVGVEQVFNGALSLYTKLMESKKEYDKKKKEEAGV